MDRNEAQDYIKLQIAEFKAELAEHLHQTVSGAVREGIRVNVNGKIDSMRASLEAHILKVMPIMEQFEDFKRGKRIIILTFKAVAFIGGVIITLGGAYLVIKGALRGFIGL